MDITIPHNYAPQGQYSYQAPLYNTLRDGYKRAIALWHRRAGKDKTLWNLIIKEALKRVGIYYYFFPTYTQGKKIIWDGIDEDGFRFLDHIPPEIRDGEPNGTELKIHLKNGSIIQIIGTDKFDAIRGTNPVGCVFSEYAFQDPRAWDVVRPILRKNGGWAIFNTTPNGENHAFDMYMMAKDNPKWFTQILTVDDTGVVSAEDIEEERKAGMSEEMIQQEFYCSFEAGAVGSYYTRVINDAISDGRIGNFPYDPNYLVSTSWDVGVGDNTSIWFYQEIGGQLRFIDFYEYSGTGMQHYYDLINKKPYQYKQHALPHDAEARIKNERADRVVDILSDLGLQNIKVVPRTKNVMSDINLVRATFSEVCIDKTNCATGLRALKAYHKEYDHKRKTYKIKPDHDWSSHAADSFRYAILAHKGISESHTILSKYGTIRDSFEITPEGGIPASIYGDPFDKGKRKPGKYVSS